MSKALFITVKDLKDNSIIDGNTDGDKLIHFIEVAQDINIHQYLGTSLYDKLQSLILSNDINNASNANYKYLRDQYIKPCLIWFTQIEFLPFSMFTIDNGGLTRHRGNNEDVIAFDEVDRLTHKAQARADFYTQRMIDYLCDNSNLFPEYLNNTGSDLDPNRDNNNFSSIVI